MKGKKNKVKQKKKSKNKERKKKNALNKTKEVVKHPSFFLFY